MKRPGGQLEQARLLLPFLALLLSLPKTAFPIFYVHGRCFTPEGLSGTASDAPSYAGAAVYRHGLSGQVGRQNASTSPYSEQALFSAGEGMPAYLLSDVNTIGQWTTLAEQGQAVVALLETRPGQFGYAGEPMAAWSTRSLDVVDLRLSAADLGPLTLKPLPKLALEIESPGQVELLWEAPEDPHGLLSSYTIYRASFPAPAPEYRYPKEYALPKPVRNLGKFLSFNNTPPPGIVWHYRIALNLAWLPGENSSVFDGGAIPGKPYFVAFGQSNEVKAFFPAPTPMVSATPSLTATLTITETPTPTPSFSETASPTLSATLTATPTPEPPAHTQTFTPSPSPARQSHRRFPFFGPVPFRWGQRLCLELPSPRARCRVDFFTLNGELAARLEARAGQACLETRHLAPGIYLARIESHEEDGQVDVRWQKAAMTP